MVDQFHTTPHEERKSQNLTFGDFAKDKLIWQALPMIAPIAGYLLGKSRGGKGFLFFDGSPMIIQQAYDKLLLKMLGEEFKINEVERLSFITQWFKESDREQVAKNTWNILKAMEITSIPLIYHLWRNKEEKSYDLKETYLRLKDLPPKPTDAELQAENASLKEQLAYLERTEPAHIAPTTMHEQPDTKTHAHSSNGTVHSHQQHTQQHAHA